MAVALSGVRYLVGQRRVRIDQRRALPAKFRSDGLQGFAGEVMPSAAFAVGFE